MVESYLRQSPLAHLQPNARIETDPGSDGAGVALCEQPFRGQIAVRGDAARKAFRESTEGVLGFALPRSPNTAAGNNDLEAGPRALWLSPDEWLVVTAPGAESEIATALRGVLARQHAAVVDVSESRIAIKLSGPDARTVLMKGCSLDLHARVFASGQCAQSSLARAHVILHQVDDSPCYDIYVHRSFAEYLWTWLEDAAAEHGFRVVDR